MPSYEPWPRTRDIKFCTSSLQDKGGEGVIRGWIRPQLHPAQPVGSEISLLPFAFFPLPFSWFFSNLVLGEQEKSCRATQSSCSSSGVWAWHSLGGRDAGRCSEQELPDPAGLCSPNYNQKPSLSTSWNKDWAPSGALGWSFKWAEENQTGLKFLLLSQAIYLRWRSQRSFDFFFFLAGPKNANKAAPKHRGNLLE